MDENNPQLFKGVEDVLESLSKDYELAVVSATNEKVIENFLSSNRILNFFKYVLGSGEPGLNWNNIPRKSQLLYKMINITGIPTKRLVYVGDSKYDYNASKEVGVDFIEARLFSGDLYSRIGKETFIDYDINERQLFFTEWRQFCIALTDIERLKNREYLTAQ
jgi:phosphoglycolate phosphatase-like HAD superfamily hydrolase